MTDSIEVAKAAYKKVTGMDFDDYGIDSRLILNIVDEVLKLILKPETETCRRCHREIVK